MLNSDYLRHDPKTIGIVAGSLSRVCAFIFYRYYIPNRLPFVSKFFKKYFFCEKN